MSRSIRDCRSSMNESSSTSRIDGCGSATTLIGGAASSGVEEAIDLRVLAVEADELRAQPVLAAGGGRALPLGADLAQAQGADRVRGRAQGMGGVGHHLAFAEADAELDGVAATRRAGPKRSEHLADHGRLPPD